MLQDPNVERYVSERLQPLQEQIKELQAEVFRLMQAKNLHLQNVSHQRELLINFLDKVSYEDIERKSTETIVDDYLKEN